MSLLASIWYPWQFIREMEIDLSHREMEIDPSHNPAITLLGIYPKDSCSIIFIVALFITARNRK